MTPDTIHAVARLREIAEGLENGSLRMVGTPMMRRQMFGAPAAILVEYLEATKVLTLDGPR